MGNILKPDFSKKYRDWIVELYPDNPEHVKAMDYILVNYLDKCLYIWHDKDVYDSDDDERGVKKGDLKKVHIHIVFYFDNPRGRSGLVKEFGIEENLWQIPRHHYDKNVKGIGGYLVYLPHIFEDEKYDYGLDALKGNSQYLRSVLKKEILKRESVDENIMVLEMQDWIDDQKEEVTIKNFARFCAQMGYWKYYRSAGMIWHRYIEEHNLQLEQDRRDNLLNPFIQ